MTSRISVDPLGNAWSTGTILDSGAIFEPGNLVLPTPGPAIFVANLAPQIPTATVKNVDPVGADQEYTTNEEVQISFNVIAGIDDSGTYTVTDQGTLPAIRAAYRR